MRLFGSINSLVIWLVLGLGSALPIPSARAAIIEFEFDASLRTGALAGTIFSGSGSYDTAGITGIGEEFISLTSLDFSLLGTVFNRGDIRQGGQAILEDGVLSYFTAAFFPPPPSGSPVSDIAFGFGGPGVIGYATPPQVFGEGAYTLSQTSIPEPASVLILAFGLLAAALISQVVQRF